MGTNRYNTFYTPVGLLNVSLLGHGSIHLDWEGMHIYVDPYSHVHDYSKDKKADLILITHAHTDHYDGKAIKDIATPNTEFIVSKSVGTCINNDLPRMRLDVNNNPLNVDPSTTLENIVSTISCVKHCVINILNNGERIKTRGIEIEAVPAYNIHQKRENGNPFHMKGEGNGYILNFGGFRVYIAGDTELIPEMEPAKGVDIAFLPKNLPYTMSDEDFVKAANLIKPKNLFPVHYFEIDGKTLMKGLNPGICLYIDGVHYTKPLADLVD